MTRGSSDFDLGAVIDQLHEGIQVVDRDFRYVYLNQVAAAHGQRRPEELIGREMTEAYPGIEQTEMFARLQRVMAEGGSERMENEFVYADGSKRWFELHIESLPVGVAILSLDITQRKTADLSLRHAQRMDAVGQLASGIAHDFNNLLTVIQSYVSLALSELSPNHPLGADLGMVRDAAASAGELTHKLLGFARQLPDDPRPVPVREATEKIVALARGVVNEAVRVSLSVPEEVGAVRVDPGALDQILLNLVINARDAMPHGGALSISATRADLTEEWALQRGVTLGRGKYAVLAVTDTGSGIPEDTIDRVFDPFFTTKGDKGVGIGLSTCWALAQQAGGTMTVYSVEGSGTTFKLFLPIDEGDETRAPPESAIGPPPSGGSATVLVVDDEEPIRTVVARVLRGAGYRVLEARSGGEALLLFEDVGEGVDLLLSDTVMPGIPGTDLALRVRARHPRIRVLLMSGFASSVHEPVDAHILSKPFTPTQILAAVAGALASEPDSRAAIP